MLSLGDLMVGRFDFKAHLLQRQADFAARALAMIERAEVEITGFVVRGGSGLSEFVRLEEEELALGADVEGIPHVRRAL